MKMKANDWNPASYLKFARERTQPAIDLVTRIKSMNPAKIADVGCGPGNSTQVLFSRWPDAGITGFDNSPSMIEKAKRDYPGLKWSLLDAGRDEFPDTYDIIFSNAALQWIPDHPRLLVKFREFLSDSGLIAVQIPLFWDMAVGKGLMRVSSGPRWNSQTGGTADSLAIHDYSYYFDILSASYSEIEIWETDYMHIMESHLSILEMVSSTGLRPFLERLDGDTERKEFEAAVLEEIIRDYPLQAGGKVIFPFKRLFFIAYK